MTNFEATHHALSVLTGDDSLEYGIHLNLTDGFPLTQIPSPSALTYSDGRFRSKLSLFGQALFPNRTFLSLVTAELEAQFEVFVRANLQPRHVTTHIHFHAVPSLRKIVYELASRYGIQWVRADALHSAVIPYNLLLRKQALRKQTSEIMTPDFIIAAKHWMGHQPEEIARKIDALEGVVEFVVHPCNQEDKTFPANILYQPHERFEEMRFFEAVMNYLKV